MLALKRISVLIVAANGAGVPRRNAGRLVDLHVKYLKRHAYLLKELAPAGRGGSKINKIRAHALKDTDLAPL